ncbi:hypothetical protein AB5T04_004376, partial [Escherichia coli]
MGKGWDASLKAGRRDRLRQEVLHRMAGGPPPKPLDYTLPGTYVALSGGPDV